MKHEPISIGTVVRATPFPTESATPEDYDLFTRGAGDPNTAVWYTGKYTARWDQLNDITLMHEGYRYGYIQ